MTKKTINNFANEDALESFNLQRLHLQVRGSRGNGCLSALSVENRHRTSDMAANYFKSNIQHPTSKIPNLLPRRPVWKIAGPVLKMGRTLSFLAILAASVGAVQGQTWTGTTSGDWSVTTNWSSAPAYNGTTDLTFSSASANSTVSGSNPSFFGSNLTIRNLTYDANADTNLRTRFTSSKSGNTARNLTFSASSGSSSISIASGATGNIEFTVGTSVVFAISINIIFSHHSLKNVYSLDNLAIFGFTEIQDFQNCVN